MPHPPPPVRRGRKRDNTLAARRRVDAAVGPVKGQGPGLKPSGPGKRYPGGPPIKGAGPALTNPKPPAVEPGPVKSRRQQPRTGAQPGPVLGSLPGAKGDSYTGTAVNQHNPGMPTSTGLGGLDRVGKRFQVGFDRAGNIVHLYGSDVPADQRRQVIKRKP